jgi:hypothetical protein
VSFSPASARLLPGSWHPEIDLFLGFGAVLEVPAGLPVPSRAHPPFRLPTRHIRPFRLPSLYVNLITAITMGMMLAAEPAEDDIMQRPPRRPGKRLLGKLVLW